MSSTIQLRRGTAAQWTAANPTLAPGEIGIETDTNKFKIGDGATAWASNSQYFQAGAGGIEPVAVTSSDLDALITAGNANPTTLFSVKGNGTLVIPAAKTIPANLLFEPKNNTKFVKSGTGSIAFAGLGLANPMSETVLFSGFGVGDITFTGSAAPRRISTALFDNTNISTRINVLNSGFGSKQVEIFATPGNLGETVTLDDNHSVQFAAGTFTNNALPASVNAVFALGSNVAVRGAGIGATIIKETSAATSNIGLFYSKGAMLVSGAAGTNDSISVSDLTIQGDSSQSINQVTAAIYLGNGNNHSVRRVHIKETHGFGAYVGGGGGTGNLARKAAIEDNIFEAVGTQNAGAINVDGLTISRNKFIRGNDVNIDSYSYYIDCEPNGAGAVMKNIVIADNVLDGTYFGNSARQLHGIMVQSAGGEMAKNVVIDGNIIKGNDITGGLTRAGFIDGITVRGAENVLIGINPIEDVSQPGVYVENSSLVRVLTNGFIRVGNYNGGLPTILLAGAANSTVAGNVIDLAPQTGYTVQNTEIRTQALSVIVNAVTTGGVTTLTRTANATMFPFWAGKTVNLSGGGITAGDYVIASANPLTNTATLTTAAGNGTGVSLTTKFDGNKFINNIGATYNLYSGDTTLVVDNVTNPPRYSWNTFLPGSLSSAYAAGYLRAGANVKPIAYTYYSKAVPSGVSTPPVIRVTGYDNSGTETAHLDITLSSSVVGGTGAITNIPASAYLLVNIQTAGAGTTLPSDVNFTVNYQMG